MRNRTGRGKPVFVGCVEQRSTGAATDIGGASYRHGLLGTSEGKFRHASWVTLLGSIDDTRCLRCDKRREPDGLEQTRFQQNCLAKRSGDTQERLVGKGNTAFWQRKNFTCKAQLSQIVQKGCIVVTDLGKKF